MKRLFALSLFFIGLSASAQTAWHNPLVESPALIQGRGFELNNYSRLPDSAQQVVRPPLWDLSRNSAGLYLQFSTNAPSITVRYTVSGSHSMPHMPATGVTGVDLYSGSDRCFGDYSFGDTIRYNYYNLEGTHDYTLFLPTYNTVKWLEVGTPNGSDFQFTAPGKELPIVIYGTSIAQGACASRPGMIWGNLLQRRLGSVVNLGFSGNGRLEPEALRFISRIPASVYILDCLPNLPGYKTEDIIKLVTEAVRQLRRNHPTTPILLVEHPGNGNAPTNKGNAENVDRINKAQHDAYTALLREKVPALYYLSRQELAMPAEGMVDYIHPTDLGMVAYADAYQAKLEKILKKSR